MWRWWEIGCVADVHKDLDFVLDVVSWAREYNHISDMADHLVERASVIDTLTVITSVLSEPCTGITL